MAYDIFSEFYDELTENAQYEKRADYFCRLLSMCGCNGGILLDLACGTGTMSVLMAQKGFDVIGVDSSTGMLSQAQEKAFECGKSILFLCQEMQDIDLYGTVDCAISVLDSLNHLDGESELRQTFEKVSLFMNSGGVFVFDMNTIYKHREVLADNAYIYDCGDLFCAWQNEYDPDDNSVGITLDFFIQDEDDAWIRSQEQFCEQAYELSDIENWLEEAGFVVKGIYDDLTLDPVKEDTQRAVFVACKK